MRRVLLLLAVLLVATLACLAGGAQAEQTPWQPRLSLYSGQFSSIAFASATTVWAAGPGGVLLSEDGGASWRWTLNSPVNRVESAGDSIHGWAVGPGGAIFATSDGGGTWKAQQSGSNVYLSAISAFDSQRAIATGADFGGAVPQSFPRSVVLRTADGGASWTEVQLPEKVELGSPAALRGGSKAWLSATRCTPDPAAPNGCTFGDRVLLVSDDAGKTWEEMHSEQPLWEMQFTSPSRGWATGESGLFQTDNGGKSWVEIREWPDTTFVSNLSVLGDDSVALLVTDNAASTQQIVKTDDAGADWSDIGGATWTVSQLRYFDATHAVRAKWDQTIEGSEDGGATWKPAATPAFATLIRPGFDFVDPMNGWLAATKLLRTRDAGQSWEAVSELQLDSVDFVSSTEGWASQTVCASGPCQSIVLHSIDGGATWSEQVRHEGSDVGHVKFVDRLNGWITLGFDKPVLHTRDGGLTWMEQHVPWGPIAFVDATTVWAASNSTVFLSTDGGDSWSPATFLTGDAGCGLETLAASDARHAWLVADDCDDNLSGPFLERSADGGAHWERLTPNTVGQFDLLTFFSSSDGVAVRALCPATEANLPCPEVVMTTCDGGLTWTTEPTPVRGMYFEDFLFTDPWHGWLSETIGGGESEMLKQTLYSYSATPPPVEMPHTGERHGESATSTAPFAALGVFGALLVGAGGFVRLRSRRVGKMGG